MARRIAQFHRVSYEQFKEGWEDAFGRKEEKEIRRMIAESYDLTKG